MFFYQISTLTAGVDIINSTTNSTGKPAADARPGAGDDLFIAGDKMLNPGDTLDGMGGIDTLKVYGADDKFTGVTLNSIEKVYNYTGSDQDVSKFADVEEYWVAGHASVSAANITTVNLATAVGVEGKYFGTLQFDFDKATGKNDAATLLLQDANVAVNATAGTGTVTIANIENLTIDAMGDSTIGTLDAAALETLTITGKGSVEATIKDVANATGQITSIDASANSGGVDLTITKTDLAAAASLSIKGGSGNDSFQFDALLSKEQFAKVDAGAGADDVLGFGATVHAFDAAAAKAINAATGFEVLDIGAAGSGTTTALSASEFTNISEFLFSGAVTGATGDSGNTPTEGKSAVNVTDVENLDMFVFAENQTGGAGETATASGSVARSGDAVAFHAKSDLGGTADTLNITLLDAVLHGGNGISASADNLQANGGAAVNASDFTSINLISLAGDKSAVFKNDLSGGDAQLNGGTGDAEHGAALVVHAGATVTITGDQELDLSDGVFTARTAEASGKVIINAKEFTGKLTVTTGAGADEITGGKGDDTITGGKGADKLAGGEGKDVFVFAKDDSGVGAHIDTITDFAKGEDKLTLTGATGVLATNSTAKDVVSALGNGTGTLTATVKDGVITLGGTRVDEVTSAAHLKTIFEVLDTGSGNAAEVGVIVVKGNTYVIGDLEGSSTYAATDVIQLQGVKDVTALTFHDNGSDDFFTLA